jgi:hypothetical protein
LENDFVGTPAAQKKPAGFGPAGKFVRLHRREDPAKAKKARPLQSTRIA